MSDEETVSKIKMVPCQWKYYCECKHEIFPRKFNYCAHCGRKLNWERDNIYIECVMKGEQCNG